MNETLKKILWVIVPTGVAGGLYYWWYKSQKPKMVLVSNNNPASTPLRKVSPSVSNSSFPLQTGSNNPYVKKLQTALGVTADGKFGPITLAALQNKFGENTVPDESTLNIIIQASTSGTTNVRDSALAIYNQFAAGGYDIQVQQGYFADEVTEDSYGHMAPTGMGFPMTPGETYDNSTYILDGVTALGLLILKVTSGSLQGEYIIDAGYISLVPHQAGYSGSILPVTDPGTGLTTIPLI